MNPKQLRVGRKGQSLTAPDGLHMTLIETGESTDGHRLELEWRVPPGNRLVAKDHYHPDGPEVWQITEGSAGYRLDAAEHTAAAPFEYTVPAATSHGHPWNTGDSPLVVRQVISSPDDTLQNLLTIHDLLLPGSFIAGPPRILQRIGLGGVAAIARATGKTPYLEPEFDAR